MADLNLENRISKLEKQLGCSQSSQLLGGDNISCFYSRIHYPTRVFTWSSDFNFYWIASGAHTGTPEESANISFVNTSNAIMWMFAIADIHIVRSDGVVLSGWVWDTNTQTIKCSSGERLGWIQYQGTGYTYSYLRINTEQVPYNPNLNSFHYDVELTLKKNVNVLMRCRVHNDEYRG